MKIFARILIAIGFSLVMIGGAGMDNASIVIPICLVVGGLSILFTGWRIEDAVNY